jgi:hypothetical protein
MLWRAIGRMRWHQPAGGILLVIPDRRAIYHDRRHRDPDSMTPSVHCHGQALAVRWPRELSDPAAHDPPIARGRCRTYAEAYAQWRRISLWWTLGPADLGRLAPGTRPFLERVGAVA